MTRLIGNYDKVLLITIFFTALLANACIPQDEEDETPAEEESSETAPWTDGLTNEQIIKAMPIVVDEVVQEDAESDAENGVVTVQLAQEDPSEKEVMVTWALPDGALPFATWNVYEGADDGTWDPIDAEVTELSASEVLEVEKYYPNFPYPVKFFGFRCWCSFFEQHIKYFKIEMIDHNGDPYENIVSFMVWPYANPLRITLSDETSASAPSEVSIMVLRRRTPCSVSSLPYTRKV